VVETLEDIYICSSKIDRLEEKGVPKQIIDDLRAWLDKEEARIQASET